MNSPMTPKERALWDAKAEEEAWDLTWRILSPWVEAAREIGHDELTQVMEGALDECEEALKRAIDKRDEAEAELKRGDG